MQDHNAHVKAWERTQWCENCTLIGGYCGDFCAGAHNWYRR